MDKSTNIGNIRKLLEVAERHGLGPVINEAYDITYNDGNTLEIQGYSKKAGSDFPDLCDEILTPLLVHDWRSEESDNYPERKWGTACIEEGGVNYYFRVSRW